MNRPIIDLRSLDCLRGVLAVYVLAGHARWLLWVGHQSWIAETHAWWENSLAYASALLRYGHEAVTVFFVLSGFFIHLRTAQHLASGESISFQPRKFGLRRLHRLVPPYYFALLVTLGADMVGGHFWPALYEGRTGDALVDRNFGRNGYSAVAVVPALCFLPSSLGADFGTNGPLWSLAYEAVYYANYPLWLWLRRWNGWAAFIAVAVLSAAAFLFPVYRFPAVVIGHYFLWIAGAGLAELTMKQRLPCRSGMTGIGLTIIAFGILIFVPSLFASMIARLLLGLGAVLSFGILLDRWSGTAVYRVAEQLGIRSYTIYICHFPLLAFLSAWLFAAFGGRPMHGWVALFGGTAVLLICLVLFQLCERHFLHTRLRVVVEPIVPIEA